MSLDFGHSFTVRLSRSCATCVNSTRLCAAGGDDEWKQHCNVVEAMSVDPVFDKSRRYVRGITVFRTHSMLTPS